MQEQIKALFTQGIQTQIATAEVLGDAIVNAAELLTQSVLSGRRVFACGEGQASVVTQEFAHLMLHGQKLERPPFPVIGLPCVGSSDGACDTYARHILALGQAQDVLLVASTDTTAAQVSKAMEAALSRGMLIVALTGDSDTDVAGLLGPDDVEIRIPSYEPNRISEQLLFVVHSLCDLIEQQVFPQEVSE